MVRQAAKVGWSNVNWHRKYTALHLAAELDRPELMPLLIALGANPLSVDSKGRSALCV